MKSFINILIYEKELRIIIHLAYVANCTSTRHLRKYIMNSLFKISYGLFALAVVSGLLTYMIATFLFFTVAVMVLAMAVAIDDTNKDQ